MNDNFYRSSGVAIAIRRISESLSDIDWFFAGCSDENLQEDSSWMPHGRYEKFNLKSTNIFVLLREIGRFKQWYRANQILLVHCHHRRLASILDFAGVPVLYTAQLSFPYELWFRWLHPSKMTAITSSVAENLLDTTGRRALACISNPAEFPPSPPSIDLSRVAARAVCIARLDPVKGHIHLLKAWKILHDRGFDYHLDLIGEGPLRPQLEKLVSQDGIAHLVRFCGFTKDVSIPIKNSLFAILVSEVEGQGIVTLEAAAMGRPSLLTAVPGSIDMIPKDGRLSNGLRYGDALGLANALEKWFASPQSVVEEGELFFRTLKNSCDPIVIGKQYRTIYEDLQTSVMA